MKQKITRKEQAKISQQKILDAASELFAERGFSNVNIVDVCKRAGVAVGSFYHYFASKNTLAEIFFNSDSNLEQRIEKYGLSGSNLNQLMQLFEYQVDYVVNEFGLEMMTQMLLGKLVNNDEGNTLFFAENRPLFQNVEALIEKAIQSGEIRLRYSSTFLTNDILRFFRSILYDWCARNGSYDLQENVKQSLGLYIRLLFTRI